MAVTNRSQLANGTQTQQGLYNQSIARKAQLENQQKYLQMAQASPAFAIGNLIGNLLADSYNSRGVNKEKQAISDALAKYQGGQDYKALNGILNSPTVTESINQGVVPQENLGQAMYDTTGQGITPMQLPDNASVPASTNGFNSFDLDKFKSQYFEDARGRGRTDAQINEAWSTMQPQIMELANKAKEARIESAMGSFANGQPLSLNTPDSIKALRQLAKDDPTFATLMLKQASNNDLNRQKFALANQNNIQKLQNAKELANYKQNLKPNNGSTSSRNSMQEYNAAAKEYDAMIKKNTIVDMATGEQKIRPIEEWDSDDLNRVKRARRIMGLSVNEQSNVPEKDSSSLMPTSTMDYNQVTDFVTRAIAEGKSRGFSNQEISQVIKNALKDKRQNGDYVDQVLEEANWNAF